MAVADLQSWADNLEVVVLPGIQGDIATLQSEQGSTAQSLSSSTQSFTDQLATHAVQIDAAQSDADAAQAAADGAATAVYQTGLNAQLYTDNRIQALRDEITALFSDYQTTISGTISTELAQGQLDAVTAAQAALDAKIAEVNALQDALNASLANFQGVTDTILDTELPTLQQGQATLSTDLSTEAGKLATLMAGYGYTTLLDGLDAAFSRADQNVAILGISELRMPATAWTIEPSSTSLTKAPALSAWFLTDDPIFLDCAELPLGEDRTIGQARPAPITDTGVYEVEIVFRVVDDGTQGGVDVSIGASTWSGETLVEQSVEKAAALGATVADGIVIASCIFSLDAAKLSALGLAVGSGVSDEAQQLSGSANKAFFYLRQNTAGATDGQIRIERILVKDVSDVKAAEAAAGEALTVAQTAEGIAQSAQEIVDGLGGNADFSREYTGWTNTTAGTGTVEGNANFSVVTTGTEVGGKALEVQGYNALVTKTLIPIDRARSYRVRIRLKNVSGSGVSLPRFLAGVATFDENLALESDSPGPHRWCVDSAYNYVPDDGAWHTYEGVITGEGATHNNFRSTTKWARLFVGLNYGQSLSQKLQVDEFRLDDITEIAEAEAFAESAEQSATTASGHATTASTNAGLATSAASAAAVSQRTAARSFSAAIIDPTFLNWTGAAPANVSFYEGTGGGTLTKSANDTFGNAIVLTTPASPPASSLHPFIQLQSSNPGLKLLASTDTLRIQIRATVEKLSGSLAGGWIRAIWYALGTGGTSGIVDVPFSTQLEDANGIQVMEALLERPETFTPGSSPGFVVLQVFSTGYGGTSPAVSFKLHALQAEAVNALATSSIAQIAKTTLDGIAASAVALTTQAGNTFASLRVASFDDLQNPYSKVEIEADYFVFRGGLAIFENAAMQSLDFVSGVSGWKITEDGNAEFNQLIVRDSLVPGAVSDGFSYLDLPEQTPAHNEVIFEQVIGEMTATQLWHLHCRVEGRIIEHWVNGQDSGTEFGQVHIQLAQKPAGGSYGAYYTVYTPGPFTTNVWASHGTVLHQVEEAEEVKIRVIVTRLNGSPGTTNPQTFVRNLGISMNHIAR